MACHQLAAQARERIGALTGLPQIRPDSPDWWGQMCAMPLPMRADMTGEDLRRRLWEDYAVEVPIVEWQGQRLIRVSIQAYNAPRDIDRLLEGLAALL
ncbi:MAG: hypothetical protein IVW57_14365 [Ktedonobacterales bacterium]|nr:hypothetical protein [Ktedonobacterales bacterium]